MPKTRDAFAFQKLYYTTCGMDISGTIFPNYEADGRNETDEKYYEKYFGSKSWTIEEGLLRYLDGEEIKSLKDFSEFEQAEERLFVIKERILKIRKKIETIDRHIVRLQSYSRHILDKLLSDGLNDVLKTKGKKVTKLITCYEDLTVLLRDYEEVLSKDWLNEEKVFQSECRKEFGRRLREARLKKKMTASDLAKQLGMSRVGYSHYELGQRDLPTPTMYRLAKILEVSLDWLFGLKA